MTGNRQDAEEVGKEASCVGLKKVAAVAHERNFGTWVYRIAAEL